MMDRRLNRDLSYNNSSGFVPMRPPSNNSSNSS